MPLVWSQFKEESIGCVLLNITWSTGQVMIDSSPLVENRDIDSNALDPGGMTPLTPTTPVVVAMIMLFFGTPPIPLSLSVSVMSHEQVLTFLFKPMVENLPCSTVEPLRSNMGFIEANWREEEEEEGALPWAFCFLSDCFVKFRRVKLHELITTEKKKQRITI